MYKGKLLTGAVLSVFMAGAYGNACAADGTSDAVYSLNPVVVTATRYEKSDAEIPAATQTFTEEQIEQTGATICRSLCSTSTVSSIPAWDRMALPYRP